jgi:hypothetical protein
VGLGLAASVAVGVGLVFAGWYTLTGPMAGDWRNWFAFTPGAADGRIPPPGYPMHAIATGFTALPLLLIVLLFITGKVGLPGSPVWVVCLSLWLFNAGYGFVSFHFGGLQFVLLLLLGLVILAANVRHPYKLCLPGLGPEYAAARAGRPKPIGVTVSPVGAKRVPLLTAEDVLTGFHTRWAADHPAGGRPKLLIVCCSGGGIRAGVWSAAVLAELERQVGPAFARHLRLITGASGGMLAAALYAGRQLVPTPGVSDAHALAKDSLWSTWQSLFFADTPSVVLPFFKNWDRAHALERSWVRNTRTPAGPSPLQATFADMIAAERSGTAPSLVFSPLMVEDGRRLLVSNLELSDLAAESAPTLAEPHGDRMAPRGRISQPAVEFFRLFPEAHGRFALATAARLSATFPYVSPAVALPTAPARRVVDAGFFDNYGVGLAAGWLLRNRRLVQEHCGGVAVIEVRAFPLEQEKTGLPESLVTAGGGLLTTVLAGVSTPAEALGVIQSAGAYYRNDHLLGILDDVFNRPERPEFFVRTSLECAGDGSLSWALSRWW